MVALVNKMVEMVTRRAKGRISEVQANIDIDFKARVVSVDSSNAFVQGKANLTGSFLGTFSDLEIE